MLLPTGKTGKITELSQLELTFELQALVARRVSVLAATGTGSATLGHLILRFSIPRDIRVSDPPAEPAIARV